MVRGCEKVGNLCPSVRPTVYNIITLNFCTGIEMYKNVHRVYVNRRLVRRRYPHENPQTSRNTTESALACSRVRIRVYIDVIIWRRHYIVGRGKLAISTEHQCRSDRRGSGESYFLICFHLLRRRYTSEFYPSENAARIVLRSLTFLAKRFKRIYFYCFQTDRK